jgi:phosphatidylglycerophosphate synthase
VLNSGLVYPAMVGQWHWSPLIPLVYDLAFVLDCVDGEIAR